MLTFNTGVVGAADFWDAPEGRGAPTMAFSPDNTKFTLSAPGRVGEVWSLFDASRPLTSIRRDEHGPMPFAFSPCGSAIFAGWGHDLNATPLVPGGPEWWYRAPEAYRLQALAVTATRLFLRFQSGTVTKKPSKNYFCGSWEGISTPTKVWAASPVESGRTNRFVCRSIAVSEQRVEVAYGENVKSGKGNVAARILTRSSTTGRLRDTRGFAVTGPLRRVFYSPDESKLIVVAGKLLHIWPADNLPAKPTLVKAPSNRHFTDAAIHPSGQFVATTFNEGSVAVYDTATWQVAKTYDWKIGRLRAVAFSPDGALAAVGSDKGKVVVWDLDV